MFAAMSNSTSLSEEAAVATVPFGTRVIAQDHLTDLNPLVSTISPQHQQQPKIKKKRSLPGNPDPDAEVIALSPKTLLATNRFVCEICNKGFQRDQNLQLHRRGHNLPWKLKQRNSKEIKKRAYVCPEPSCVHHHPSRALGDLTGIKKHYCRKHGEKKWKCEKCSKIYAVQSDWKAHSKTCGTREYRCDCGTLFSRKDSFITHRAFCDALAEESARLSAHQLVSTNNIIHPSTDQPLLPQTHHHTSFFPPPLSSHHHISLWDSPQNPNNGTTTDNVVVSHPQNPVHIIKPETPPHHHHNLHIPPPLLFQGPAPVQAAPPLSNPQQYLSSSATSDHLLSATALLQKAVSVGATQPVGHSHMTHLDMGELGAGGITTWQKSDRFTRDFLGLTEDEPHHHHGCNGNGSSGGVAGVNVSLNVRDMLKYTGGVGLQQQQYSHERDHTVLLKPPAGGGHRLGFAPAAASQTWSDC